MPGFAAIEALKKKRVLGGRGKAGIETKSHSARKVPKISEADFKFGWITINHFAEHRVQSGSAARTPVLVRGQSAAGLLD